MKRQVVDCDRCDAKEIVSVSIHLGVGSSSDPAGGPSSIDYVEFDLCEKCAAWAFNTVACSLEFGPAAELAKMIGKKVKR